MSWVKSPTTRNIALVGLIALAGVLMMVEPTLALCMAPAIAVFLLLFTGHYLGEEAVARATFGKRHSRLRGSVPIRRRLDAGLVFRRLLELAEVRIPRAPPALSLF